jgi:hypothetical protein
MGVTIGEYLSGRLSSLLTKLKKETYADNKKENNTIKEPALSIVEN